MADVDKVEQVTHHESIRMPTEEDVETEVADCLIYMVEQVTHHERIRMPAEEDDVGVEDLFAHYQVTAKNGEQRTQDEMEGFIRNAEDPNEYSKWNWDLINKMISHCDFKCSKTERPLNTIPVNEVTHIDGDDKVTAIFVKPNGLLTEPILCDVTCNMFKDCMQINTKCCCW